MSSQQYSHDITQSRDGSNSTALDRRATASTSSSNRGQSFASNETGESSKDASNGGSLINSDGTDEQGEGAEEGAHRLDVKKLGHKEKGAHKSHRSRGSGGFLLSNSTLKPLTKEAPRGSSDRDYQMRQRLPVKDRKGKASTKSTEKEQAKSSMGLRVQSSPLSMNVTSAPSPTDEKQGSINVDPTAHSTPEAAGGLDVDSAQIVSLALNLNESRRNAARRNVSTPLPPLTPGFTEGFAGGSLRHHLQQQRRVSRNVSPKPTRGERAVTSSPRITSAHRLASPLQPAFDPQVDGNYKYNFSASTLARAEKAKTTIELMAQYRRLLLYVPPLKPQKDRVGGSDRGNSSEATTSAPTSRVPSATSVSPLSLGRQYNPLQYIRNRKVRARTGRAIHGDAQGFGDLSKVSSWVDQVLMEASSSEYQDADCLPIPTFSKAAEEAASPHASPSSHHGTGQSMTPKMKRPRNDWITDPKDLLADLYWLEQDENKKLIEDSHGRKIFSQVDDLKRPISKTGNDTESPLNSSNQIRQQVSGLDLRVDTKLPEFKPVKSEPEKHIDGAVSKAKGKLRQVRDAARPHHGIIGSAHPGRQAHHSLSRSDSDSGDSSLMHRSRRTRSGTADSNERGADILEKQMMELLAKEAKDDDWHKRENMKAPGESISERSEKPGLNDNHINARDRSPTQDRSGSVVNKHRKTESLVYSSSGRASLEVPGRGSRPRHSLDDTDSTAPNSPEANATRVLSAMVPNMGLDSSPPHSRHASPSRKPLSRVKEKISTFQESHKIKRVSLDDPSTRLVSTAPVPETPSPVEKRRRSISPFKSSSNKKADSSVRPSIKSTGSVRKSKHEESGIRGLFKGRNPVARVGDFVWKTAKEQIPGLSSGFSTDDSDVDEPTPPSIKAKKDSVVSSAESMDEDTLVGLPKKENTKYTHDLPIFTSPFEGRGRPVRIRNSDSKSSSDAYGRESHRATARSSGLEPPPRIDVHRASPTSSPDSGGPTRSRRDSSVSDIDTSRRQSLASGARLNQILGMPGHRRNALPMTGLTNLEVSGDRRSLDSQRQWSISDRVPSIHRGPVNKREVARVQALLLSSGIKAKEISRRAAEFQDLRTTTDPHYTEIAKFAHGPISPVPKSQQHILAARILEADIQLSSRVWQASTEEFVGTSIQKLFDDINILRSKVNDGLTNMTRTAADEADEVSKDLVTSQTLTVKALTDKMDVMMRRRRRRFRWLRRGGWVIVEWA